MGDSIFSKKAMNSRISRLVGLFFVFSFLMLAVQDSRFGFPQVYALKATPGEDVNADTGPNEDSLSRSIFIPFLSDGGFGQPDQMGTDPTLSAPIPSATNIPVESTSTVVSTVTPTATSSLTPTPTQDPTACDFPVRVMPLGDSITKGSGSTSINGYRKPLIHLLEEAGYFTDFVGSQQDGSLDFDRNHEGHSGWFADGSSQYSIADSVYGFLTTHPADIVLLHIGTNDIQEGHASSGDIAQILDEVRRRSADITVVLALIINQAELNPEVTSFNAEVLQMALERIANGDKILLVDMESALLYPADMADTLHPNNSGYGKIADVWFATLAGLLPVCTSP